MKVFYILTALFITISCSNNTTHSDNLENDSKSAKIQTFWNWFESKSEEYLNFAKNKTELFNLLSEELHNVNPSITFVFGEMKDNKREFIISADGIKEAFPDVEALVSAAPKINKWEIIAFRPRLNTFLSMSFDGLTVSPDDLKIKYSYDSLSKKVGLEIYIKNYNESDQRYLSAAFLILDNALGEYDVETKIGAIDFKTLPDDYKSLELISINELPNIVDNYFKK